MSSRSATAFTATPEDFFAMAGEVGFGAVFFVTITFLVADLAAGDTAAEAGVDEVFEGLTAGVEGEAKISSSVSVLVAGTFAGSALFAGAFFTGFFFTTGDFFGAGVVVFFAGGAAVAKMSSREAAEGARTAAVRSSRGGTITSAFALVAFAGFGAPKISSTSSSSISLMDVGVGRGCE